MSQVINDGALDVRAVMTRIPHRFPFLMIDRVLEIEPKQRAIAIKNISINEAQFQGHFPQEPVMPGVLMVEALAQLGGVVMADPEDENPDIGFLASVDKAKFRRVVRPGDQLRLEVEVLSARRKMAKIKAVASVEGETAVEAEIMFAFQPRSAA